MENRGYTPVWRILLCCIFTLVGGSQTVSAAVKSSTFTVVSAYFGVEAFPYMLTTKVDVTNVVKAVYATYACIAIPGDQPKFFAVDPAPGVEKVVLITIKTQVPGQPNPIITLLRAPQGTDYLYPSNAPNGAAVLKTLKYNMQQPGYVPPGA